MTVIEKKKNQLNIRFLPKELACTIDSLIEESKCTIQDKQWCSKYNSFVRYDYEPFCSDGFEILYEIIGDQHNINYLKYLIDQRLEVIETLKKMVA